MPVVEEIPDDDRVSRHLYRPSMGSATSDLRWDNVFMFEASYGRRESLVWSRYAATLTAVHFLGCEKQRADRAKDKPTTYLGALSSSVGAIRRLKSKNGARFEIVHAPNEGMHHVEMTFAAAPAPNKNDRSELKVLLREVFGGADEHVCPDEQAA